MRKIKNSSLMKTKSRIGMLPLTIIRDSVNDLKKAFINSRVNFVPKSGCDYKIRDNVAFFFKFLSHSYAIVYIVIKLSLSIS